jgi:aspartate aminotransferase
MRLSDRVSRISVSSTAAALMEADRCRAAGADLVDLGAGEPDFPTPENIRRAAIEAIQSGFTRYTPTGGITELKEAICQWHRREFGTEYTTAEVLVTCGGKHAIFNAVSALINAGDEVLLPAPHWVSYPDIIRYAAGQPVLVPTEEADGYALRAEAVERAITPRTRLLILNSPNNPSGAVVPPGEVRRILELLSARGISLLSDECYSHFVYEGAPFSAGALPGARENAIVAGSLSKTFAMTGWRIGFALARPELIRAMMKLQSHSTSNPNSIAQKAAVEALTGPQDVVGMMRREYQRRRDLVVEGLNRIPGIRCPMPQGAFYVFPNVAAFLDAGAKQGQPSGARPASSAELAGRLLREGRVVTVPGEGFGAAGHLRLSYATSMRELKRGIERIAEFLGRLNPA